MEFAIMDDNIAEYLRTPEAARHLSVSHQYLEVSRCRGEGPPYVKLGRAVRYRRAALDEWAKSRECRPNQDGQDDGHARMGSRGSSL